MKSPAGRKWVALGTGLVLLIVGLLLVPDSGKTAPPEPKDDYAANAQPIIKEYCLGCHSTKSKKGSLDLERFTSVEHLRGDLKPWLAAVEMLEAGEMPPKSKPQPTADERRRLLAWIHGFLDSEARARAGDPGHIPLRRLSNAEYDYTIRDLTGVNLQPARDFPADGAAGEGFTNAAESLTDVSPALLTKYLNAAKDIADHAVLLPDGMRFSPTKTRRDWTDECNARIRAFYADYTPSDGRLPLAPYLLATIRHRDELASGKLTPEAVALKEKLSPKYLHVLWQTLTDREPSFPLDRIRARWRQATEKDVAGLAAEIGDWQAMLWKFVNIGSYRDGNKGRQVPNDFATVGTQTLKLNLKPIPGQNEVVVSLVNRTWPAGGHVIWQRPRLEGANKPTLLLRDYAQFGPQYEVDYAALFADTEKYLSAAVEAANDRKLAPADLAKKHDLDAVWLKRWIDVLAVEPLVKDKTEPEEIGKVVPLVALELLDEKIPKNEKQPAINGWRKKGTDLPSCLTNSSDKVENVPGRIAPHHVTVHPTPKEFVAVVWKSPIEGRVRIAAHVAHVHPACGNGVAWWLEHRRGERAAVLAEGVLDVGQEIQAPAKTLKVAKGDIVLLAIDARDGDHVCDLTDIALTVTETDKPGRTWDLAADVADTIHDGNPHADKLGSKDVWSFVRGPAKPPGKGPTGSLVPAASVLGRWREAASDPARKADASKLAAQVRAVLAGTRPAEDKNPNRILFDNLVSPDSPLIRGLDLSHLTKPRPGPSRFGLEKDRFGRKPGEEASLIVAGNAVVEVRLPAALFRDREFVVEASLDSDATDSVAQFQVVRATPAPNTPWDSKSPILTAAGSPTNKRLLQGFEQFRRCFPTFVCYPHIIPTDEVVCLKQFHRDDEPLVRLFLDDEQTGRLNRLWQEHRFISQWPISENKYLPLFIGFVTQDQPKELVVFFEGFREPFRKRAEEFEKELDAAGPKQLDALLALTARAYRRPLAEKEKNDLLGLYRSLRQKGVAHEEAFRGVLARVLVSPSYIFRVEQAPPGKEARAVNDWELATRLSYFLGSTLPDDELRREATAGRLHEPAVLEAQTRRLLKDERTRALAIEFGTQWIHVRGFDQLKEKNEKLFPAFDDKLRQAIYEESILFFQDLFQNDRSVTRILDADDTFLNETLAKHYGIPGVVGPQWRKVEGVKKYGRGGILGLASVQCKESGASRTSPVLRGNWVVETLLGEKLPRPPPNVPRLPEEESGNDGKTMRQLVESHTKNPDCAVCHVRIDPFGFALERYDPIGRLRDKDLGGLPIDTHSRLKDGTEFEGIEGLRTYLLTKKKDVIVRLFCRRLLGYALGRAVTLSDQLLLDEMVAELNKNDGRLSAAVLTIVQSKQFRMIRGSDQ
jgi:hypothetical protein